MASSIHHGPPGSYKTYACVQRFVIQALEKGRTVVTNIRGLSSVDKFKDNLPEITIHDQAQIIYIDTSTNDGRSLMARWFHWSPPGALVLIDECQFIYPKKLKLESLELFDQASFEANFFKIATPTDEAGNPVPRPLEFYQAIDMQRHFNFDLYLTSTNIKKVNAEIRESAESAYLHISTEGLLPWKKGTWKEVLHDAENNGKLDSYRIGTPKNYKADPRVYQCYQSTATGIHVKEFTRQSILKDRKLQFYLFIILASWGAFIYFLQDKLSNNEAEPVALVDAALSDDTDYPAHRLAAGHHDDNRPNAEGSTLTQSSLPDTTIRPTERPWENLEIYLVARQFNNTLFMVSIDDQWKKIDSNYLLLQGYSMVTRKDTVIISKQGKRKIVTLPPLEHCTGYTRYENNFSLIGCFKEEVKEEENPAVQPII